MRTGLFISFEGSEACGKTTQISQLTERLRSLGLEVVATREPGGTPLGEAIRRLLKHAPEGEGMCAESELLLFEASRAQLVKEIITPALERDAVVVSDRFFDSTTVYQGIARTIPSEVVAQLNAFAVGNLIPDITFLMDLSLEEGRRRLEHRAESADRIEQENDAFFAKVRAGYLALAQESAARIEVLDGALAPEALHNLIWAELTQRFHGFFEKHRI